MLVKLGRAVPWGRPLALAGARPVPALVLCRGLPEERFWWPSQPLFGGARLSISRRSGKPACCPAGFLGTASEAVRGGAACEPRAGDPWGAGSGPARVSVAVSLGLLSARLQIILHVLILALNPTLPGGLSLGPGAKKVCWARFPQSFRPLSPKSAKTQAQEARNEGSASPSHGKRRDHYPWKTSSMGHPSMGHSWEKGCPWPGGAPWLC